MQMPDLEEPLSAQRPQFEPELDTQRAPEEWRVMTNFVEPKDILGRFGRWPDDLLTSKYLQSLYREESEGGCSPFSREAGSKVRPLFPFLDDAEVGRLAVIWDAARDSTISVLRDTCRALPDIGERSSSLPGWFNLVFQMRLILELRAREKELGIWEERTEAQRTGTIFALRPAATTTFARISAMPISEDSFLCVSWGGPFSEYSRVLPLLENPYTQRLMASADDQLEVVPEGHALKRMVAAGLLREYRVSFMNSRWAISVPVMGWEQARDVVPVASRAARDVSETLAPLLSRIHEVMRSGRYSYVEGTGDYFEMAYSVFVGYLFQWAMEDGLLSRPPKFRMEKRGPVLERSRAERRSATSNLPGITLVRHAEWPWDRWVTLG
jgi:hypothetical protein